MLFLLQLKTIANLAISFRHFICSFKIEFDCIFHEISKSFALLQICMYQLTFYMTLHLMRYTFYTLYLCRLLKALPKFVTETFDQTLKKIHSISFSNISYYYFSDGDQWHHSPYVGFCYRQVAILHTSITRCPSLSSFPNLIARSYSKFVYLVLAYLTCLPSSLFISQMIPRGRYMYVPKCACKILTCNHGPLSVFLTQQLQMFSQL
jgi:hypothetical protein